ncbi:MAG: hypothetical protein ACT4OM_12600 [Actinomycetota bacterium]
MRQPIDSEPLHEAELVDALLDDLIGGDAPETAIQKLLHRGVPGRVAGLDSMSSRVTALRKRWAEQGDYNRAVERFSARLRSILDQEQAGLAGATTADAGLKLAQLDILPGSTGEALESLSGYRFSTEPLQSAFSQLVEQVRDTTINAQMAELAATMKQAKPQELAEIREMLEEIAAMVVARTAGGQHDFPGFMAKHSNRFPEDPQSLDQFGKDGIARPAPLRTLCPAAGGD